MCCDCIGLIKGAVWSELGAHATRYGTGGCPDKGANGMLEYCKAKGMAHGSMNTLPEIPGLLLHKQGHVGVYIGGGYAIEAKGFNADVVKSKVAGRGWTSWAKLPFIDYADGEGAVEAPTAPETTYTLGQRLLKRGCKGSDVAELQKAPDKLGLTVKSQTQKTVPQTYSEDIYSTTLGMTVKAGDATGMSAVVTTETEEGITIESECIGKVYAKDEFDKNEWTIIGEPETTLVINKPATVELTCASVVNRIPDVMNSKAGYVPTEEMGDLYYRTKPLNEYVR